MGVAFIPDLSIEHLINFYHLLPSRKGPILRSILINEIHSTHGQGRETAAPLSWQEWSQITQWANRFSWGFSEHCQPLSIFKVLLELKCLAPGKYDTRLMFQMTSYPHILILDIITRLRFIPRPSNGWLELRWDEQLTLSVIDLRPSLNRFAIAWILLRYLIHCPINQPVKIHSVATDIDTAVMQRDKRIMTLLRLTKVRAIHNHAAIVKRVKFGSEPIIVIHNIK